MGGVAQAIVRAPCHARAASFSF